MRRANGNDAVKTLILMWMFMLALQAHGQVAESKRRIIVSIPDRKLALVVDNAVVKVYPIAVGAKRSPSPTGTYEVHVRVTNPTYYHEHKVIAPGSDNPVGPRWIGLNTKGYGIHGTNEPHSIGRAASHGCIRMRNEDVTELFAMVQVRDVVEIRGERDLETVQIFGGTIDNDVLANTTVASAATAGDSPSAVVVNTSASSLQ